MDIDDTNTIKKKCICYYFTLEKNVFHINICIPFYQYQMFLSNKLFQVMNMCQV